MIDKLIRTLSAMCVTISLSLMIAISLLLDWMARQPPNISIFMPVVFCAAPVILIGFNFWAERRITRLRLRLCDGCSE